jgi:triacylglycerol lipase
MKRSIIAFLGSLALGTLLASPALAMSKQTADVEARVRELGKRWDAEVLQKTAPLYVPLLQKVSRQGLAIEKDIGYGTDEKQKLDIYVAEKKIRNRPVVVYIHGGGLTGGDKDSPNTEGTQNSNVPVYFAKHGMVGVSVNYRLVPQAKYPSGGEDLRGAVTWLRGNVAKYGGDPNAIFLIGHSAGGTHLGTYMYDADVQSKDGPSVAGAIFLSGVPELDKAGPRQTVTRAYYGDDESEWAALDSYNKLDGYKGPKIPTFIITAELDPSALEMPGVRLYQKLCVRDQACPRYLQAQNQNHLSTSLSLGTDDDSVGGEMRDFIRKTLAARPIQKTAQKM